MSLDTVKAHRTWPQEMCIVLVLVPGCPGALEV